MKLITNLEVGICKIKDDVNVQELYFDGEVKRLPLFQTQEMFDHAYKNKRYNFRQYKLHNEVRYLILIASTITWSLTKDEFDIIFEELSYDAIKDVIFLGEPLC